MWPCPSPPCRHAPRAASGSGYGGKTAKSLLARAPSGATRKWLQKKSPWRKAKRLPRWVARKKRRATGWVVPGEGGGCGSAYRFPNLGEGTKVAGHNPSLPCSSDAECTWSQFKPALHGCAGLEKIRVLLVWQRGPGLTGPKGSRVAFLPCLQLVSSSEV